MNVQIKKSGADEEEKKFANESELPKFSEQYYTFLIMEMLFK